MRLWESSYPGTLFAAVTALIGAALLVVYLQLLETERHEQQAVAIVQQLTSRTVVDAGTRFRRLLDGPFIDSIARTEKMDIREKNWPEVVASFGHSLTTHPVVDRFFFWSDGLPAPFHDQVAFVERSSSARGEPVFTAGGEHATEATLTADPPTGRLIFEVARKSSRSRKSYAVVDLQIDGRPHQVVLQVQWANPFRTKFCGIMGYTVDLGQAPRALFAELMRGDLPRALSSSPPLPRLTLTVLDEKGRMLYGAPVPPGVPIAHASVDALFFPVDTLHPYLSTRPDPRWWTLTVSPAAPVTPWYTTRYWASGAAVALILIALFCAVSVARHSNRLFRLQADFVANVSHQLKTPLSMLSGASETLGLGRVRSPEKVREYAEIVRAQTGRLSKLVDQMLVLSRTEINQRNEPVDVASLVEGTVTAFAHDLPADQATLTVEASHTSSVVRGDADALEQVVLNLLDNAVKYRNASRNQIAVRVDSVADGAVISVRDRGIGIERADVPHIFEKFYRGSGNGHRPPGFGLGLAIVQTIVHAHRGRVSVTSEPGRGSEFRVFLPRTSHGRFNGAPSIGR